jgi:hypothetical protein
MKSIVLLVSISSLLFKYDFLSAQEKVQNLPPRYIIKFAPLSLFDYTHNSIQAAFEYRLNKFFTIQHEAGIILPLTTYEEKNTGLRLRSEFRFFPVVRKKLCYFALDFLYIHAHYKNLQGLYTLPDEPSEHDYQYYAEKSVYASHLKFGIQPKIKKFVLDLYLGPGLRSVAVNHRERNLPSEGKQVRPEVPDVFGTGIKEEGTFGYLSLAAGFKIGYILKY